MIETYCTASDACISKLMMKIWKTRQDMNEWGNLVSSKNTETLCEIPRRVLWLIFFCLPCKFVDFLVNHFLDKTCSHKEWHSVLKNVSVNEKCKTGHTIIVTAVSFLLRYYESERFVILSRIPHWLKRETMYSCDELPAIELSLHDAHMRQ